MISKSSLVNQIRHNCKRRIWCLAILSLGFFLTLPMFIAGRTSQIKYAFMEADGNSVVDNFFLYDAFTPNGNYYSTLMLLIAAVLTGISSFCYLNSKSQVDLYHSMPISRKKLFSIRFLSGYVLFLIPYTFNLCVAGIVAMVHGGMSKSGWESVFQMFGFQNIYFLAIYTLVCLAVIISGNLLNNLIITGVLMFGEVFAHVVFSTLRNMFFYTYYPSDRKNIYFTPFYKLYDAMARNYPHNCDIYQAFYVDSKDVYKMLMWIVVVVAAAVILFCKRSSEKAGKAIIFPWMELVIKVFLTVLITYSGGFICESFFVYNSFGWFLFGGIAGFVLSHILLEMLFRGDFRAAFKHMWHWAVDAVLVAIVLGIYWFDVFGYDAYIPKKNEIVSASVCFYRLDSKIDYVDYVDTRGNLYGDYQDCATYRLENMTLTDISKLYELVKIGVASEEKINPWAEYIAIDDTTAGQYSSYNYEFYNFDKESTIQALEEVQNGSNAWDSIDNNFSFVVKYELKNGIEIYRKYVVDFSNETVADLVASIYDQPVFKTGEYPILTNEVKDEHLVSLNVGTTTGLYSKRLNETQTQEFLEIYREELSNMTFEKVMEEEGIGTLEFEYRQNMNSGYLNDYFYYTLSGYPLYPSFTRTIEYLDGLGIDVNLDLTKLTVLSLHVTTSGFCYEVEEGFHYPFVEYADADMGTIQQILSATDWKYNTHDLSEDLALLDVEVEYYNEETGENSWNYGQFKSGEIPDFVLTDMVEVLQELEID